MSISTTGPRPAAVADSARGRSGRALRAAATPRARARVPRLRAQPLPRRLDVRLVDVLLSRRYWHTDGQSQRAGAAEQSGRPLRLADCRRDRRQSLERVREVAALPQSLEQLDALPEPLDRARRLALASMDPAEVEAGEALAPGVAERARPLPPSSCSGSARSKSPMWNAMFERLIRLEATSHSSPISRAIARACSWSSPARSYSAVFVRTSARLFSDHARPRAEPEPLVQRARVRVVLDRLVVATAAVGEATGGVQRVRRRQNRRRVAPERTVEPGAPSRRWPCISQKRQSGADEPEREARIPAARARHARARGGCRARLEPLQPVAPGPAGQLAARPRCASARKSLGVPAPRGRRRSPLPSSRSSAYSRIVSSIENRALVRLLPDRGAGSCRRATSSPSSSRASQTASAASSVQPPAKTASRSSSAARPRREQVVAPVDRRRGASAAAPGGRAAPPVSSSRRSVEPRRAARCGASSLIRAAASSIASGRRSSRAQIASTAASFVLGESKLGRRRRPRALGEELPAQLARSSSGGTGYSCSTAEPQRRPARHEQLQLRRGREQLRDERRRGVEQLLEVVERRAAAPRPRRRAASVSAQARSPGVSRTPSACAIVGGTSSASATRRERRRRRRRPRSRRRARCATSSASRVLPAPARAGERERAATSARRAARRPRASSRSRPTSGVGGAGRPASAPRGRRARESSSGPG